MRKPFVIVAALALLATPVLAQTQMPPPSLDQQVSEAQSRLVAAQAELYLAVAKQKQAQVTEGAQREAATAAWWASWWSGMFPAAPAPAAAVAPQK